MTPRATLLLLLLLAPALTSTTAAAQETGGAGSGDSAAARRRSVLLLVADDLGTDLGCYGNADVRTPRLDALAGQGVRFTHAFAAVASCSPSRASLYTGQFIHTNGQYGLAHAVHNFHTFRQAPSLPRVLGGKGFRSGIIGKLHVQPKEVYPFDVEVADGLGGNRDVAAIARRARQFFDADARPFLLVVGFSDPHRAARGFANQRAYPGVAPAKYDPAALKLPYFLPDQPDVRRDLADYYEAISRLDQGVGMVLDALQESGRADDTLVLFLSDNGMPFPGAKTTLYDPGVRLPLVVRAPGRDREQSGLTNEAMVSWVDVAPTVLDWLGVPVPAGMAGRSFLPVLGQRRPQGWEEVYGSHVFHEVTMYYPMRMVRTRRHKYVLNLAHGLEFPSASDIHGSPAWQAVLRRDDGMMGRRTLEQFLRRPREELYDLDNDPEELRNVAADPAYADVVKDLRARVKAWQERTKDPWVVKYQHE